MWIFQKCMGHVFLELEAMIERSRVQAAAIHPMGPKIFPMREKPQLQ